MKKFFLVLGSLLVLLVGAVIAAPFLVPTETIKSQLTAQVEAATGRKLAVDGALDLSVLPSLGVDMGDVRFANAEGSDVADMVALKELKVELKVLPLLTGAVEIDQFVLVEPVIYLEVDANGKPNWALGEPTGSTVGSDSETSDASGDDSLPITDLKLGDIRIENGTLIFTDHSAGTEERVEAIDMQLGLADIKSPLEAKGSLGYKGETIELDLGLAAPYDVIEGGGSALSLGVKSTKLEIGFDGQLGNQGAPNAAGKIDLSIPSVKGLAAWLAEPLGLETEALEALTIAGQLNGSADKIAFTDAVISLDDIKGKGEVTTDLTGTVPKVSGRLDLGMVDLNPYMPAPVDDAAASTEETAASTGDQTEVEPAGATGWSEEPIEVPLGGVDLAFELTLEGLKAQEVKLGRTVLALNMAGQKLTADLKEFALYGGNGQGRLSVDASSGQTRVEKQFTLTGLKALPFLTDAAEFERLEGTANAEFKISTTGGSERQFVENLFGDGKVAFTDGAIVGINVASMVRNVGSAFLSADANEARKTDFAELGGSFTIENGILTNNDLQLQAPALRVNGSGTVDLPAKTVDYRIEPKAAATLEGQEGSTDVAGVLVPVVVQGPFDDLSYKPDLGNLVDQAIKDPDALKENVKQQLDAVGGATKDLNSAKDLKKALKKIGKEDGKKLLEGLTSGDPDAEESPAGSLLKGLLKK